MNNQMLFIVNVIVPILIAPIYFILAFYTLKIKPLRLLIMGEKTYQYGFLVFFFFGLFFLGRPFQVLLGGGQFPFIISSFREFIMIACITPCVVIGILNQLFYDSDFKYYIPNLVFGFCIFLGLLFIFFNGKSIGGSHEIFNLKFLGINIVGHDGNWFGVGSHQKYLIFLFLIRLIAPVGLMSIIGSLAIYKSINFSKNTIYENIPKKYLLEGIAVLIFIFSIFLTGILAYFFNFQTQWYYLGALASGIIGYISLKIPPRNFIIQNDLNNKKQKNL